MMFSYFLCSFATKNKLIINFINRVKYEINENFHNPLLESLMVVLALNSFHK